MIDKHKIENSLSSYFGLPKFEVSEEDLNKFLQIQVKIGIVQQLEDLLSLRIHAAQSGKSTYILDVKIAILNLQLEELTRGDTTNEQK